MSQPVKVLLDDRIRLLSAVLSVTNFPQKAQERKRHHAHAHARATMKYLHDNGHHEHVAVKGLQTMLDNGVSLESLFGVVYQCAFPYMTITHPPKWIPENWTLSLWDFYQDTDLKTFWELPQQNRAWEDALTQSTNIFGSITFHAFLKPFFGEIPQEMVFVPNIGYPADNEVGFKTEKQLVSIVPPPLAWGESPPWPFDEETNITHSYRAGLAQYIRLLLTDYLRQHAEKVAEASQKELPITEQLKAQYPTWEAQFIALFISGAVAIYLEDHVNKAEAESFALMEKRARGMSILPATISVMRRYMQEHGNRFQTLADFLTVFPTQLRVAKKIVTM